MWKYGNIYLNCGEIRYDNMTDHRSYTHILSSCVIKAKKIRLERFPNPCNDLWTTGAVLYQLSYQANWELVTLWGRSIPVDDEDAKEY